MVSKKTSTHKQKKRNYRQVSKYNNIRRRKTIREKSDKEDYGSSMRVKVHERKSIFNVRLEKRKLDYGAEMRRKLSERRSTHRTVKTKKARVGRKRKPYTAFDKRKSGRIR